ncbi:hypothetical protein QAD02_022491 [Eretmocerus hayati]|uniref:Uncharacterized protein n=1 Tax=Eretmocerus hayati TaxID=131215 RepID=A0ACC2PWG2_9HYME|nr:hypothetical protein QAD02_022491 [Eretmocerus hayati]
MAACLENIQIPSCVWFDGGDKRNALASMLAGILFFTGWWLVIDVSAIYKDVMQPHYHVWGIIGTISLLMVNSVTNAQIRGEAYDGGFLGAQGARGWLFIGFVMGFAAVIASSWILFVDFLADGKKSSWPGVGLFLQNAFIFFGSLTYKFGRSEENWG